MAKKYMPRRSTRVRYTDKKTELEPNNIGRSIIVILILISLFPALKFITGTPADWGDDIVENGTTNEPVIATERISGDKSTLERDTEYTLSDVYGAGTSTTRNGPASYEITVDDNGVLKMTKWHATRVKWTHLPGNEIPHVIFTEDSAEIFSKQNPLQ